jgi:ribosomal protein L10
LERQEKQKAVEELEERLKRAGALFLAEYTA